MNRDIVCPKHNCKLVAYQKIDSICPECDKLDDFAAIYYNDFSYECHYKKFLTTVKIYKSRIIIYVNYKYFAFHPIIDSIRNTYSFDEMQKYFIDGSLKQRIEEIIKLCQIL